MTDIPYEFRLEKVLVQYQRANSKIALQARQIEELTSKLKKYKKYQQKKTSFKQLQVECQQAQKKIESLNLDIKSF